MVSNNIWFPSESDRCQRSLSPEFYSEMPAARYSLDPSWGGYSEKSWKISPATFGALAVILLYHPSQTGHCEYAFRISNKNLEPNKYKSNTIED